MEEIYVSGALLEEMFNANSVMELGEGRARELVRLKNKDYVITGSTSSGAKGIIDVRGHEAVLLVNYSGNVKPMTRKEHDFAVIKGTRERGYTGLVFTFQGKKYVCQGPRIDFKAIKEAEQQTLF